MREPVTFEVPGPPQPKQRARRSRNGRWYTPRATVAYEEAVGWVARAAGVRRPCEGPVRLTLRLWFPDQRRRDLDNCAKSILDGLNRVAWQDDSQVVELTVTRRLDRDRPRAEVTLAALTVRDVLLDEVGQHLDPEALRQAVEALP